MEKINTMIRPKGLKHVHVGQILFEEYSETFYKIHTITEKTAVLEPFESKQFNDLLKNIFVYVNDTTIQTYTLLPRT